MPRLIRTHAPRAAVRATKSILRVSTRSNRSERPIHRRITIALRRAYLESGFKSVRPDRLVLSKRGRVDF
jgi:hypothetical protein